MVWALQIDDGEAYTVGYTMLDGDYRKVEYVDTTRDVRSLGAAFSTGRHQLGRAVKPDNIPTKLIRKGRKKKELPDVFWASGMIFANRNFRNVLENLEPEVHQYLPVELLWQDHSNAADVFYFNVCNRLDSVDHERTEHEMYKGVGYDLGANRDLLLAFDLKKIGKHAIWYDKHLHPFAGAWISNDFKEVLEAAEVTGIKFRHFKDSSDFYG